jgi:hypothetical protein
MHPRIRALRSITPALAAVRPARARGRPGTRRVSEDTGAGKIYVTAINDTGT